MRNIADAGLLIGFVDAADDAHDWAVRVMTEAVPPFLVCEPVITEAAAVLGSADAILQMLERGDLKIEFVLETESAAVRALMRRYKPGMDLADACVVRMAELTGGTVFTVDKKDFSIYRKHGRQSVPCVFPD